MPSYQRLLPGDPAPWFHARSSSRRDFAFDTIAGRYVVLCFFASAGDARGRAAVDAAIARKRFFDDEFASFFGVSIDPADEAQARVVGSVPGYRFFWDLDGKISRLYGAIALDAEPSKGRVPLRRMWVVLDPTLRVMQVIPFLKDGGDAEHLESYLDGLPPPARFAGFEVPAPILVLPNVFESGFMVEEDGRTVVRQGYDHKRRSDYEITDPAVISQARQRVARRIAPEILKVHQFRATRMERYLIACYTAEAGGHFRAHRDNTTKGTAHRRFAVSINLNDDYEGGEIGFPEYGPRWFKPPVGGAVVFSCSLLHAVARMTRGRRYAFLPFLYDDEAARLREANSAFLGDDVSPYGQE